MPGVADFLTDRLRVIGRDDDRGDPCLRVLSQFVDNLDTRYVVVEMVVH